MQAARLGRQAMTLIVSLALLVLTAESGRAQAHRNPATPTLRHIQTIDPHTGPVGTLVSIRTENLPLQARIHLGIGATREGFETLSEVAQGEWGDISGTIRIPETAPWDRAIVVVALNAIFSPIGISDPFHVTNTDGMVRRTGRITDEGETCPTLRDEDDYLYTLTGDLGAARPGDQVVIEGTYSETSRCELGKTIGVVRLVPNVR